MKSRNANLLALFTDALKRLFADEAIPLAGNIAFRTLFALFPFLIFLTSLAGFLGSEAAAEHIVTFLLSVAPEALVKPFAPEIRSILTVPRADLLSIGAILTIWSAMGGVDSVRVGLNRAYDLKETRSFAYLYAQNIVFVVAAAGLMLTVSLLLVVLPVLREALSTYAPAALTRFTALDTLRYPFAMVLLFTGLHFSHRILPAKALRPTEVLPGVIVTVLVWTVLTSSFSYYLIHFKSFSSTYASLSGLFAAFFFVYLAALVLIFGGEVNRTIMVARNGAPNADAPTIH